MSLAVGISGEEKRTHHLLKGLGEDSVARLIGIDVEQRLRAGSVGVSAHHVDVAWDRSPFRRDRSHVGGLEGCLDVGGLDPKASVRGNEKSIEGLDSGHRCRGVGPTEEP